MSESESTRRGAEGTPEEGEGRPAGEAAGATSGDGSGSAEGTAEKAIEELTRERDELKDRWLRLSAEFQNYKKRTARDHDRLRATITMEVLREFLPVLDDFDRAVEAAGTADLNSMRDGMRLIAGALAQVMRSHGVEEIAAHGTAFDHNLHDAMLQVPDPSVPEGTVTEVAAKGYTLSGLLMRPAKVLVSTGGPRAEPTGDDASTAGGAEVEPES